MTNPLHMRAVSGFPLSIATGLAMETLFKPRQAVADPNRVSPTRIALNNYKEIWINIQTLIRNIYQAADKNSQMNTTPAFMYEVLESEIELIEDLLNNEGNGLLKPVFFINNYDTLFFSSSRVYKKREDKTALQMQARFVYKQTADFAYRNLKNVQHFNLKLNGNQTKAIILTHNAADLLSHREFLTLDFLESHTGKIKNKLEWYTKYYSVPNANMSRLPFCRQLLGVFGDSSMISPIAINIRKEIIELSNKCYWNPTTPAAKVSNDLNKLSDPSWSGSIRSVPIY